MKHKEERADIVRGAAVRAERVARRLLRRTRSLAQQASQRLPLGSPSPLSPSTGSTGKHMTLVLPAPSPQADAQELAAEVVLLRARLERSEHAAAWLRARLRAERMRRMATPTLDADAVAAGLTRDLAGLRAHDAEAIGRAVRRVLTAHGLPVRTQAARGAAGGQDTAPLPGWSREQQEAVAAQALARAPEVANPLYVHRALALVAVHGSGTLAHLTRMSGFDSAMGKRRLRLAIDALVALGALVVRDGIYTLDTEYRPARQPHRQDLSARYSAGARHSSHNGQTNRGAPRPPGDR